MSKQRRLELVNKLIDHGLTVDEHSELDRLQMEPWDSIDDECHCICHSPDIVAMHAIACCYPCQRCGRNITIGSIDRHNATCKGLDSMPEPPIDIKNEVRMAAMDDFVTADAWSWDGYVATQEDIDKLASGVDPRTIGPKGPTKPIDNYRKDFIEEESWKDSQAFLRKWFPEGT